MPRRTKEEAEQTRRTLLTASLELFSQQGVQNTSLKAVSAAAGVTHGALYWHFKNREDILVTLCSDYPLPLQKGFFEQLHLVDQNALEALRLYLLEVFKAIHQSSEALQIFRLFYLKRGELPESAVLDVLVAEQMQQWYGYINQYLKQARKQQQLDISTEQMPIAQLLVSTMLGVFCSEPHASELSLDEVAEMAINVSIEGLKNCFWEQQASLSA